MITPRDSEYAEAREYKESRRQMLAPFADVADWIASEFTVERPLQVRLDRPGRPIPPDRSFRAQKYRLEVIFDHEDQAALFRCPDSANFDKQKQDRIAATFLDMLDQFHARSGNVLGKLIGLPRNRLPNRSQITKSGFFVVFSSFEWVARQEANSAIPASEIEQLERELAPCGIWKVFRPYAGVTFMFQTDKQARDAETNGLYERCREAYWRLLEPHDRYGYFARQPIWDRCDSRETFERDYKGSWQFYMR